MAEPEVLFAGHYQALRSETLERIKIRDQYVVWLATVFTAALGVYVTDPQKWWGFLLGIPLLAAMSGLLYAHTDLTLNALGQWYRKIYGAAIDDYRRINDIGYDIPFWDHSDQYAAYTRTPTFCFRYFATAIVILTLGFVSTQISMPYLKTATPQWHLLVYVIQLLLSVVGCAGPIGAWWVRFSGH